MSVLDWFRLEGKTALVTGCKRGIGRAMAVALAEAGADIVGVSATLEPGSAVENEVRALGRQFTPYACDFGDRPAVRHFIERVTSDWPVIDILVNNAGTIFRAPAAEYPDEEWDRLIEINLNAQFILSREIGTQALARHMLRCTRSRCYRRNLLIDDRACQLHLRSRNHAPIAELDAERLAWRQCLAVGRVFYPCKAQATVIDGKAPRQPWAA